MSAKFRRVAASSSIAAMAAALIAAAGCGDDGPTSSKNLSPQIRSLTVNPESVVLGGQTRVTVLASDPNADPLTVTWQSGAGTFENPSAASTVWSAPEAAGEMRLRVTVSDGEFTAADSVDVLVGNASLVVLSDPPGAFIELDGTPLAVRTPHRFALVAAGFHSIALTNAYYQYEQTAKSVELMHEREDTLRFGTRAPVLTALNLGRSDLLEIGGIAFLPGGTGVLYAGRTPEGTGLFNSTLSPVPKPGNGARIVADVRVNEPVVVSPDGKRIVFVTADGRLETAAFRDDQGDGIIDELSDIRLLDLNSRYGPALSTDNRLAFTSSPSDEPATAPIFWGTYQDTVLTGIRLATNSVGHRPTWEPGSDRLAYAREGLILFTQVSEGTLSPSDTLMAEGYATAPAWGPWGPKHVAFLSGADADHLDAVRLAAPGTPYALTVLPGLQDPRFLAWSPTQLAVAVTSHGASGGRVTILYGLPIP